MTLRSDELRVILFGHRRHIGPRRARRNRGDRPDPTTDRRHRPRSPRELAHTYRLGAVTDTSVMTSEQVRAVLRGSHLDELLEVIVTSVDVGAPKPDPRGLRRALDIFGVTPAQALFVGDADCDEDAATAAGVAFVRAGRGRSPGPALHAYLNARLAQVRPPVIAP